MGQGEVCRGKVAGYSQSYFAGSAKTPGAALVVATKRKARVNMPDEIIQPPRAQAASSRRLEMWFFRKGHVPKLAAMNAVIDHAMGMYHRPKHESLLLKSLPSNVGGRSIIDLAISSQPPP